MCFWWVSVWVGPWGGCGGFTPLDYSRGFYCPLSCVRRSKLFGSRGSHMCFHPATPLPVPSYPDPRFIWAHPNGGRAVAFFGVCLTVGHLIDAGQFGLLGTDFLARPGDFRYLAPGRQPRQPGRGLASTLVLECATSMTPPPIPAQSPPMGLVPVCCRSHASPSSTNFGLGGRGFGGPTGAFAMPMHGRYCPQARGP